MQKTLYRRFGACIAALVMGCAEDSTEPQNTSTPYMQLGSAAPVLLGSSTPVVADEQSIEGSIVALYRTTFGPEAELGALDYWFDVARGGGTLRQIAVSFTHSEAYIPISQKSNETFVQGLYQNALGREGDPAGVAFWTQALNNGQTRVDLLLQFSRVAGLSEVELASLCTAERLDDWCVQ